MDRILDDPATPQKFDPTGMIQWIENFHEQCAEGVSIARAFDMPNMQGIQNVVVCGMGGSAIGGDLMRSYASSIALAPIEVVRSYQLPRYANENTLLVASSYSGNTEETLSAYEQAKACGAKILGISTGGQLAQRCQQDGHPCIITKGGMSPRAALGYSFMPLLVAFERLGLVENQSQAIESTLAILKESSQQFRYNSPFENNFAKQLSKALYGSIPVIYAGQNAFEPIAARWRAQINENAKTFAHNMVVPEMNHNEILGWKNPKPSILKKLHVVYLLDQGYHPQTLRRFDVMKKIIEPSAHGVSVVQSKGDSLLARMFYTISVGDFASCYLAYFYKEDPTPIPAIDFLKAELAKVD
ncbi:MAG: bifunctional phosphoglucose/phosphomannose isomerase [Candidatus Hinthialibacter antarcticus]|nr:bifunctional phosphoglucose/phosphomannose isomerase [Candidatus Hinthialibacter antarcticus]